MGSKLLFRPKPKDDETFYNYITRLADVNACPIKWLISEMGLIYINEPNKINRLCFKNRVNTISKFIGFDRSIIISMTHYKYSYRHEDPYQYPDNLPFAAYYYSGYCPYCLRELYYDRIKWQLKPIKTCINHNVYLVTECPSCKKRISLDDIYKRVCGSCGYTLTDANPITCNDMKNQAKIHFALDLLSKKSIDKSDYYHGLNSLEFLRFYNMLYNFLVDNMHIYELFDIDCEPILKNCPQLYALLCTDRILLDWPNSIYTLMDLYKRRMREGRFPIPKNTIEFFELYGFPARGCYPAFRECIDLKRKLS